MTTYIVQATRDGYKLGITQASVEPLLSPGDTMLRERGGHGVIESLYGAAERHYHDALSIARGDEDTNVTEARQ